MSLTIESVFTIGGIPKIGLAPILKIWEINGVIKTLVVGPVIMADVADGYYLFDFTTFLGYDNTKSYSVLIDGGVSLPPNERYQTTSYNPVDISTNSVTTLINGIWDEPKLSHIVGGSTGEALNEINSDTQQIRLDTVQILLLIEEVLKYDKNRTKIDKINNELIIYDNDLVTILRRFKLKDSNGVPSVDEVCERLPI